MSEISLDIVTDGITLALRKEFPASFITDKSVKQGLTLPAFLVRHETVTAAPRSANYWHYSLPTDVIYIPKDHKENFNEITDRLTRILCVLDLPTGDKIRGLNMSAHAENGALHFNVTYSYNGTYMPKEEPMDSLKIM